MNEQTPVSDIMVKNVVALTRNDDLERAEMLFNKHRIKHIPVVARGTIIGMLSFTDLMRISSAEADADDKRTVGSVVSNSFTIEQVMAKDIITISSDTTIKGVTKILAEREFHALPVVDDGQLVGIVTTRDLLKYYLKYY
jgi:CBS domain-containing membrane protein